MSSTRRDRGGPAALTRRQFLPMAALPWAAHALGEAKGPAPGAGSAPFAFAALGDVHFDRPEHHDMGWLRRDHPNDVAQVENYSRITREVAPKLFDAIRRLASDPPRGIPIPFAAQLGDLVEGMCGTPGLARRQCEEALAFIREADLGIPLRMIKGNHEIQGPGAAEAFNDILLPALCGPEPRRGSASYTVEQGSALFAFLDAYDPGALDWLGHALGAREPRHRHVFVLLHPPAVPFCARSTWHLYARPADAPMRSRLLNLLGKHRAIVLSGHLHKYGVVVRETESGPFLQLALNSVLPRPDARPRDEVSGSERYGPDLVALEPRFSPQTEAARREALRAEAPFIAHFEYADAPGYALVTVGEENVTAAIHAGLDAKPWKMLDLTGLLSRS